MSGAKNIVIVAQDQGLRRSLAFALEVEGYSTESYDALWKADASSKEALCAVIDDEILKSEPLTADFLCRPVRRVILLVDGMSPQKARGDVINLTKPIDGSDLLGLVNSLAAKAKAHSTDGA